MLLTNTQKRLAIIFSIPVFILMIPLVAMQFTHEVAWTLFDFIVAGILLFGTALLCELTIRKLTTKRLRLFVCGVILLGLAVVWLELAVGLFGAVLAENNSGEDGIQHVHIFAPAVTFQRVLLH